MRMAVCDDEALFRDKIQFTALINMVFFSCSKIYLD